jgi:hypothetical protein
LQLPFCNLLEASIPEAACFFYHSANLASSIPLPLSFQKPYLFSHLLQSFQLLAAYLIHHLLIHPLQSIILCLGF